MANDYGSSGEFRGWFRSCFKSCGRILHRLLHPGYEEERARSDRILTKLADKVGVQIRQLRSVERNLHKAQTEARSLKWQTRYSNRLQTQLLKNSDLEAEHGLSEKRISLRGEKWLRGTGPIIVGPWTGEVGFELLYWVPFVRWLVSKFRLEPSRLVIVSRGGVSRWYGPLARQYVDIFSLLTTDQFRVGTGQNPLKQRIISRFDKHLIRLASRSIGLKRASLLHPTLMYELFNSYWKQKVTFNRIDAFKGYQQLPEAQESMLPKEFPDEFLAARFYFSKCFPDTGENRKFVAKVLEALSAHLPVVLLNTDFHSDDHRDFVPPKSDRIYVLSDHMRPENNLAVQTAVVSMARTFVGTYGGYSYLAPLCGVDSLAFYSLRNFRQCHLDHAQHVFGSLGLASLVPLDVKKTGLVDLLIRQ